MSRPLRAVASIHDVHPGTLDRVGELLELLRPRAGTAVALLVVPGLEWPEAAIDRVRGWVREGYEVAGHGWLHRGAPRTLYHRLHGLLLSRDQAEHLSLSRGEISERLHRGRAWFAAHGLPAPTLYVPPAWALGAATPSDLAAGGYRIAELLRGYLRTDPEGGGCRRTPLVGFETDTRIRELAVGLFNTLNLGWARRSGRPLRIGLHPFDLELRSAGALHRTLAEPEAWLRTEEAVELLETPG